MTKEKTENTGREIRFEALFKQCLDKYFFHNPQYITVWNERLLEVLFQVLAEGNMEYACKILWLINYVQSTVRKNEAN